MEAVGIWLAAFLTLCIFSFLYKDNPFYKFAEHCFVGVSAGFWMATYYHNTIDPKLLQPIGRFFWELSHRDAEVLAMVNNQEIKIQGITPTYYSILLIIPLVFSIMLLMRVIPRFSWMSRMGIALMVGTGSGLYIINYLKSNVVSQIYSAIVPIFNNAGVGWWVILGNFILLFGTLFGLLYFFFSKAHTGAFGLGAKIGIYFIMISFGVSFGYTVMARVSLLIGRLDFLINTWIGGMI